MAPLALTRSCSVHIIFESEANKAVASTSSVNPLDVEACQFEGVNRSTPFFSTPVGFRWVCYYLVLRSCGGAYIECNPSPETSTWVIRQVKLYKIGS